MFQFFSPEAPLARWMSFLLDALLVSAAWLICALPVITLGASTAALNRVAQNWMRDRSGCDIRHFFAAFRENLKGGTMVWLILLAPLCLIGFNAYAAWIAALEISAAAKWMVAVTALLWIATAIYAFALQAVFENRPVRTVANALRIALSNPLTTLILIALFAFAVFCFLVFPAGAFLYTPACVFLSARPIWNILQKVMDMPEVIVADGMECEKEGNDQ